MPRCFAALAVAVCLLTGALGPVRTAAGDDPPSPKLPPASPSVDLDPRLKVDLEEPPIPRPDLTPEQIKEAEAQTTSFAAVLNPGIPGFDQAEAAGLPRGSRPRILTLKDAYSLALIRTRASKDRADDDRAAILDPRELDAQSRRLGVPDFDRFTKDWLDERGAAEAGFRDPAANFFDLLRRLEAIERTGHQVATGEMILKLYRELVKGASSVLSQEDVDRIDLALSRTETDLRAEAGAYRDVLDAFKVQLGLPADAALVPDRSPLKGFHQVFQELDRWQANPAHDMEDARRLLDRLPKLWDAALDGRSISKANPDEPDQIETMLRDAVRFASKARPIDDRRALRIRATIRRLVRTRRDYDRTGSRLFLSLRMNESALQSLVAPPEAHHDDTGAGRSQQTTIRLIELQDQIRGSEVRLVALWLGFQTDRLALDRDLGIVPFDGWDAFLGSFQADTAPPGRGAPQAPPIAPLPPPVPRN
jgi:hypothetical protein